MGSRDGQDQLVDLLAPFLAAPERAAILTDFDGTLAPIVRDPLDARPLPGAVDAVRQLARRYGLVAVISGRPVSFLIDQIGAPGQSGESSESGGGLVLSGLYGLEEARGQADGTWEVRAHAEAAAWRPVVDEVAARAAADGPAGLFVEHKGLALTLHWRAHPETASWAEQFAVEVAGQTGLVVHAAKASAELRPPVERDKGTVVTELVAGTRAEVVCFCGDDVGDLPAFAALGRLGARHSLAVVARSTEMAPTLEAAADLVVDGPTGVLELFNQLLDGLPPAGR